ncbi:hypothetical protein X962_6189 [Burkholderia pseudomallei MSHR7343]|uniref:hypothetical protein n=1 Tax=Burkholderia pseudomallei TaxID=28450 RepID=UPI000530BF8F
MMVEQVPLGHYIRSSDRRAAHAGRPRAACVDVHKNRSFCGQVGRDHNCAQRRIKSHHRASKRTNQPRREIVRIARQQVLARRTAGARKNAHQESSRARRGTVTCPRF